MHDIVDVGSRLLNGVWMKYKLGQPRFEWIPDPGRKVEESLFYTRSGESMGSVMVHANVDKHTELE